MCWFFFVCAVIVALFSVLYNCNQMLILILCRSWAYISTAQVLKYNFSFPFSFPFFFVLKKSAKFKN
jgi:hypothetical protein